MEIVNETFKKPCMVLCVCVRVHACVFVHVCWNFTSSFGYINYISSHHTVVLFDV